MQFLLCFYARKRWTNVTYGRSSDLFRFSERLPAKRSGTECSDIIETYSSGNCYRIARYSLLARLLFTTREPKRDKGSKFYFKTDFFALYLRQKGNFVNDVYSIKRAKNVNRIK